MSIQEQASIYCAPEPGVSGAGSAPPVEDVLLLNAGGNLLLNAGGSLLLNE